MTPLEFSRQTKAAAAQVGRLSDEGVARAATILQETQAQIALQLNNAPSEYGEWFYTQLQSSMDRITQDLAARYTMALESDLDTMANLVIDAVDGPVERAGLTLSLPSVSRQTVEMLSGFRPGELISKLTIDAKTKIQAQLQQAILGTLSPQDLQRTLAANLDSASIFRTIHLRAEAIWRTEAARVYNVLSQERYRRIDALHPGRMQKQWLHSGNTRHPRTHHAAMHGTTIPISEKFLVGSYAADGPHDPDLPASETVRCGCTSILVLVA